MSMVQNVGRHTDSAALGEINVHDKGYFLVKM